MNSSYRPTLNELMAGTAILWSSRATCLKLKAGAVICTPDYQIVTTGYNGSLRREPHCTDSGCIEEGGHCVRCVHAEQNAILSAAELGRPIANCILFATHRPCIRCAISLIRVRISEVHYLSRYDSDGSHDLVAERFRNAKIPCGRLELSSSLHDWVNLLFGSN